MEKGLTQVQGKMYQKARVVMLPSKQRDGLNKTTQLFIYNNKLCLSNKPIDNNIISSSIFDEYQHLYIVSNEEIGEGDWFIGKATGRPQRCIDKKHEQILAQADSKRDKIMASTDPELTIDKRQYIYAQSERRCLPRLKDSFIRKYVELQGRVDEVLVEVTREFFEDTSELYTEDGQPCIEINEPKVAPDNTISIKKVDQKDGWNRGEVSKMLYRCWEAAIEYHEDDSDFPMGDCKKSCPDVNEWIETNLK